HRPDQSGDMGAGVEALTCLEAESGAVLRVIAHTSKAAQFGATRTARDAAGHYGLAAWNESAVLFSRRGVRVVQETPVRRIESPTLLRLEGKDMASAPVCLMVQVHDGAEL